MRDRFRAKPSLPRSRRYSPAKKVQTLSASCLRHLAHLRSKMDEWETTRLQQQQQQHHQQQKQQEAGTSGTAGGSAASSVLDGTSDVEDADGGGGAAAAASGGLLGDAGDAELVVRTAHDAWLVLRSAAGGRRLYTAAEQGLQGPELSLAGAAAATEVLCDRLFPGVFVQP